MKSRTKRAFAAIGAFVAAATLQASPALALCEHIKAPEKERVYLYGDADCEGPSNSYDLSAGPMFDDVDKGGEFDGDYNDLYSSIRVGKGIKVTIYEDGDLGGRHTTLWPGDYPHLEWFSDKISSVKLERIPEDERTVTLHDLDKPKDGATKHTVGAKRYNFSGVRDDLILSGAIDTENKWAGSITLAPHMKVTAYDSYDGKGSSKPFQTDGESQTFTLGMRLRSMVVEKRALPEPKALPKDKVVAVDGRWHRVDPRGCLNCSHVSYEISTGSEHSREIGSESSTAHEISGSVTVGVTASESALVASVEESLQISAGYAFTTSHAKSIVDSFTTSVSEAVVEECNLGAMWQWRSEALRTCPGKNSDCDPFLAKGKTVCTTPDAIPPYAEGFKTVNGKRVGKNLPNRAWNGCEVVASGVEFEGEGPSLGGSVVMLDPQYRCQWNVQTAYTGKTLEQRSNIANPRDCRMACAGTVGCAAWTLDEKAGQCTLHAQLGKQERRVGSSSGSVLEPKKEAKTAVETDELAAALRALNTTLSGQQVATASQPKAEPAIAIDAASADGYTVTLTAIGGNKVAVMKAILGGTGLGLKQVKAFVESPLPVQVMTGIPEHEATEMAQTLEAAGATASVASTGSATAPASDIDTARKEVVEAFKSQGCGMPFDREFMADAGIDVAQHGAALFAMMTARDIRSDGDEIWMISDGC